MQKGPFSECYINICPSLTIHFSHFPFPNVSSPEIAPMGVG